VWSALCSSFSAHGRTSCQPVRVPASLRLVVLHAVYTPNRWLQGDHTTAPARPSAGHAREKCVHWPVRPCSLQVLRCGCARRPGFGDRGGRAAAARRAPLEFVEKLLTTNLTSTDTTERNVLLRVPPAAALFLCRPSCRSPSPGYVSPGTVPLSGDRFLRPSTPDPCVRLGVRKGAHLRRSRPRWEKRRFLPWQAGFRPSRARREGPAGSRRGPETTPGSP
jgi:hypothetical protein